MSDLFEDACAMTARIMIKGLLGWLCMWNVAVIDGVMHGKGDCGAMMVFCTAKGSVG